MAALNNSLPSSRPPLNSSTSSSSSSSKKWTTSPPQFYYSADQNNGTNTDKGSIVHQAKVETVQSSEHYDSKNTKKQGLSMFRYFTSELTRGYLPEKDQKNFTEKRKRIYTFIQVPLQLEQFIIYGFFQCVDAFLFIFTFLPLRICLALIKLLTHPCGFFMYGSRKILEPAQTCDILKGIIIVISCCILSYLDISMMYHIIRGQAVLKLYVFYNIVELADKLFIGIGQDFLDSLFWSATEPRGRKREHIGVVGHLLLAIIYVILHSILILVQATILNVAFNSHNKSLLIIMMSNNFVEIKINVFKRVDKKNLFQISCSDARERFQYIILLFVVFVRNMAEFSWNPDHIAVILPDAVMILIAEVIVDWLKHAFITKFNEISQEVYADYSLSLAQDMISSRQTHAFTDHSDLLSRRMGFTPLPLACILYQVCVRSFKVHGYVGFAVLVMVYLCLMSTKVLNTMLLLGRANQLIYGCSTSSSSNSTPSSPPGTEGPEPGHRPPPASSSMTSTPTADSNLRHRTAPFKVNTPSTGTCPFAVTPSTPPPTPTQACEPFLNTISTATVSAASTKSLATGTGSRCSSFISSNRHWEDEISVAALPSATDATSAAGEASANELATKLSYLKPGSPFVIEHQPLPSTDCDSQMSSKIVDTAVSLGQKDYLSRSDLEVSNNVDSLDDLEKPLTL